jgi:hypothetical protein
VRVAQKQHFRQLSTTDSEYKIFVNTTNLRVTLGHLLCQFVQTCYRSFSSSVCDSTADRAGKTAAIENGFNDSRISPQVEDNTEAELGEYQHYSTPLQFQCMVLTKTESSPEHISLVNSDAAKSLLISVVIK